MKRYDIHVYAHFKDRPDLEVSKDLDNIKELNKEITRCLSIEKATDINMHLEILISTKVV